MLLKFDNVSTLIKQVGMQLFWVPFSKIARSSGFDRCRYRRVAIRQSLPLFGRNYNLYDLASVALSYTF